MTRALIFVGILISLCSCSSKLSEHYPVEKSELDSSKVIYNAAFAICSLKYEMQDAESSWFRFYVFNDSLRADSTKKRCDKLGVMQENAIDKFISLTRFGSKNVWHIGSYTNFIRIQYLQTNLPEAYFADYKNEILLISQELNISMKKLINPADTSQNFLLSNLTMKVLDEIDVDSNKINYETLKKVNILVQSFGDFTNPDYFPCFIQDNEYNCGPACLKTITDHYNIYYSLTTIEKLADADTSGTTFDQLAIAAEKMGFNASHKRISFKELYEHELPVIVHWNDNHFVVLYEFTEEKVKIADPTNGTAHITYETFWNHWLFDNGQAVTTGNILEIKPKYLEKR